LAREAIASALAGLRPPPAGAAAVLARLAPARGPLRASPAPDQAGWRFLAEPGAAFVTLTQAGELRGCIGSLEPHRPLAVDVQYNAIDAALGDPRFPPLRPEELGQTDIEVSVLGKPSPIQFVDRADLLGQLRPGVDGLILAARGRRGTFLPQVWEQLPTPELFLAHLVRKAGLPAGYWGSDVRIWGYTVTAFEENPCEQTPPPPAQPAPGAEAPARDGTVEGVEPAPPGRTASVDGAPPRDATGRDGEPAAPGRTASGPEAPARDGTVRGAEPVPPGRLASDVEAPARDATGRDGEPVPPGRTASSDGAATRDAAIPGGGATVPGRTASGYARGGTGRGVETAPGGPAFEA
jgi:AmmeMemoRadiSam system protein A